MTSIFYLIGIVMIITSAVIVDISRFVTHEMEAITLFVGRWFLVALARASDELQLIRESLQLIRDRR